MFYCRIASFDTEEEALSLILWRGYDCGVNGVSDLIYHCGIPGVRKGINKQNTIARLKFLDEHNLLPIPDHQAYGSFYITEKLPKTVLTPMNTEVEVIRNTLVKHEGHIFMTLIPEFNNPCRWINLPPVELCS